MTQPVNRKQPLKVYVSDEEKAEITERARLASMSVSNYLKAAGLQHRIRSVVDLHAVKELMQVNADMGRLGGLLKMYLTNFETDQAARSEVAAILKSIGETQQTLRERASDMTA